MAKERAGSCRKEDGRGGEKRVEDEIRRGVAVIRKVIDARSKGIKLRVGWNEKGEAVDPNKSTFVGYIGVVARKKVPITITDWRQVSEVTKKAIWDEVALSFEIEVKRKKYVLAEAGLLARNFRTFLGRVWVRDDDGNINYNPPSQYEIPHADWTAFVKVRTGEEFQQLSKKNRARAKGHVYPYMNSNLGHAPEKQIKTKKRKKTQPDCTDVTQAPARRISRSNSETESDKMRSISPENPSHRINDMSGDNLSAKTLKKKEHLSRVRGVGFGVSQRGPSKEMDAEEMEIQRLNSQMYTLMEMAASLQLQLNKLMSSGSRQPQQYLAMSLEDKLSRTS